MPTIRTENPRAFRTLAESLVTDLSSLEREITSRRQHESTIVCGSCGNDAPVDTARLGADGTILCASCLPAYGFCQVSHRYHPTADIITAYDGSALAVHHNGMQMARNQRHSYTCALCGDYFYGSPQQMRSGHGASTICRHCADANAFRCDGCGYHHRDESAADSCCGSSDHNEYREVQLTVQEGSDFSRFSERPVGLELETGAGGRKVKVLRWLKKNIPTWGCTSDGSLASGGWEYISSPMSGNIILESYKGFATAMIEREVAVESQRAGYHVHVNAKDIYAYILKLQQDGKGTEADAAEDIMQKWGKAIIKFSQSLVAPWRREACYCNGEFGYRSSKGEYPRHLRKARGSSYPVIAIRKPTLEFRVFPSTANIDWHLGRIEFAQKSVDLLFAAIQSADGAAKLQGLVEVLEGQHPDCKGAVKVEFVCLTLNISAESQKALLKMHKFWTPSEYADGKPVDNSYKKEPKPRKPRTSHIVVPPLPV